MSELKWNWTYAPYLDPPEDQKESAQNAGYVKVVSKDEADKVIAHHKYKRCLATAMWCDSEMNYWYDRIEMEQCQRFKFYNKWHNRWLELAEKFKEAK